MNTRVLSLVMGLMFGFLAATQLREDSRVPIFGDGLGRFVLPVLFLVGSVQCLFQAARKEGPDFQFHSPGIAIGGFVVIFVLGVGGFALGDRLGWSDGVVFVVQFPLMLLVFSGQRALTRRRAAEGTAE